MDQVKPDASQMWTQTEMEALLAERDHLQVSVWPNDCMLFPWMRDERVCIFVVVGVVYSLCVAVVVCSLCV